MVVWGTGAIRYDAERRPVRVNDGATVLWRASYDGDGARRKRVDAKGTIHYLGGYERNVGNGMDTTETITKYYRALGRLIAFRRNGSLYWVGTDHLGGTVAVASSSFGLVAGMRYSPYGVSRDNTDDPLTDNLFTGQKLDASVGLYWYGSRAYDAGLGRFFCPDSIVPSAGNPQALNRYAYTYNNPMRYADPSGHNPYDGAGIVVYDNPSYLPVEQRQALYEHNSNPSISNGSQGTVHVHESGGGGGGGGVGPAAPASALSADAGVAAASTPLTAADGQTLAGQNDTVRASFEAVWKQDAARRWIQEHNLALYGNAVTGTPDERMLLSSALADLATSGTGVARETSDYFMSGAGTVQFGGGPLLNQRGIPGTGMSVGWDNKVYLDENVRGWPSQVVATWIAHETYHAEQPTNRRPLSKAEEFQAYTRQAQAWDVLSVDYKGPVPEQFTEVAAAYHAGADALRNYINNTPPYNWPGLYGD